MIGWIKQLRITFGASFLWLVCLIYFTQGFRSFVWTAISYQLKYRLKLPSSASQFVTSISFVPWSIKPIYGLYPNQRKKKDSLFSHRDTVLPLSMDVVIDAMIAEAARHEKATFSGDLQSLSWMTMALGGICGSLFGGYALNNIQMNNIFLLFSVLPTIQLFSCAFVADSSISSSQLPEFSTSINSIGILDEARLSPQSPPKPGTLMRKRSHKSSKKISINTSKYPETEKDESLPSQWFQSFQKAGYTLFKVFQRPIILRPMAWFFLAQVTIPNLSKVMFYYQTEVLNLEASFLGTAYVNGWIGLMFGTFTYNRFLKKVKLRTILMFAHVTLTQLTLLDLILVSRLNVSHGISDKVMVLFGSVLSDAVQQFKFMPFLILSGQLCPPGIEGTLFALYMSINNFGSAMSSFVGDTLASFLNISSGSFDNLSLGIAIQVVCTLVPLIFLFLIPKDATGISI
ncbi:probable folate-biopterin transporter 4 isoform X3 [Helianthus annuus]|uniref:probable folate-biopterin transporter 4 isoform X3 n=1 Tax=Helianthus annuus TaxID=4232 RepID=UPI000B90A18B|nr:probable folate-biopterin transporter 4 isoform X3 [Helianthus annuus]